MLSIFIVCFNSLFSVWILDFHALYGMIPLENLYGSEMFYMRCYQGSKKIYQTSRGIWLLQENENKIISTDFASHISFPIEIFQIKIQFYIQNFNDFTVSWKNRT